MGPCVRFRVYGMVQGVGYRYFTLHSARALGITGYVQNLPDGSVLVVARGDEPALGALEEVLHRGPSFSRVERVVREAATGEPEVFADFSIR